jgi:hypothetical protein
MSTIKTISLHQPWGSFVTDSLKQFETRGWQTSHRGLLAIHAAKKWDDEQQEITGDLAERFPELRKYIQHTPPLGAILGICRLVHCYETEAIRNGLGKLERAVGDYGDGRFAWKLQLLEVFDEPIPAKGAQKIWDWTPPTGFFDNRVAIIGSRQFPDVVTVYEYVQKLPQDTIVISGGAKGVDQAAEYAARQCGLKVISIPVLEDEWGLYKDEKSGKSYAGHNRNQAIIDMAGRVVAFHESNSPGTANSISKAKAAGKPLLINPHKSDSSTGESPALAQPRLSRDDVLPVAQEMAGMLKIACEQLQIAGSLRRNKPDVKDVELVAVPRVFATDNALIWLLDKLLEEGAIEKAKLGETGQQRWGNKLRSWVYRGTKFDLFMVEEHNFGIEHQLKTGSRDFNILLMTKLKSAPFRLDKFAAYWNDSLLHIPDEKLWFKLLGLPFISPSQRNVETLQEMFATQWKGWGDPKQFVHQAKQLTLGGDFKMHDEGALIAYLEKKEKLKPDVHLRTNYQWDKPWLFDNQNVWVTDKRYGFNLVHIDSREAALQARKLSGFYYGEYTTELIDWLNIQRGEVPTPNYRPEYDQEGDTFPYAYVFNRYFDENFNKEGLVEMCLALTDIQPTQDTVSYGVAKRYFRDHVLRDENGNLPLGIKFQDTPVLLINGHHRYAGNWWADVPKMTVMVDVLPIIIAEAFDLNEDDGSADLLLFADILDEAIAILKEAKELEHA